jgi:hypothetical protein
MLSGLGRTLVRAPARARRRLWVAQARMRRSIARAVPRPTVPPLMPVVQRAAMGASSVVLIALTPRLDPGAVVAPPVPEVISEESVSAPPLPAGVDEPWSGRSGRLLARLVTWDPASRGVPGLYLLDADGRPETEPYAAVLPFRAKIGPYVGNYRLGFWPEERRRSYDPEDLPAGFIEVHRQDVDIRISAHFSLGDFLVQDSRQEHVWPKYVVIREELIEKLELVLDEIERMGIPASHVRVLSGFRSPEHNARGGHHGMAAESRHQYGDAVDLIIDADLDGRMDDLNGDGRVDINDAMLLAAAVERVESRHPDLIGGLGVYHAMGPSGPFVHIDVRGTRARWGAGAPATGRSRSASWNARPSWGESRTRPHGAVGRCLAEGASAVLCQGVN